VQSKESAQPAMRGECEKKEKIETPLVMNLWA